MMSPFLRASLTALSFITLAQSAALPQTVSPSSSSLPQVTTLHQFPNGTWLENLAVRRSGGVLMTTLSGPQVLYLDPSDNYETSNLIATFAGSAGTSGIAEFEPDIFYVASSSFNFSDLNPSGVGTGNIWRLNLTKYDGCKDGPPPVEFVTNFPQSGLLNGIAPIAEKNLLLVADSTVGVVWQLNLQTKAINVAINNTFTQLNETAAAAGAPRIAANGVHLRDGYAYLTNTASALYARVPIDENGIATGPGDIINQGAIFPDDFIFGAHGEEAYVTDGQLNAVQYVDDSGSAKPIASVFGPTAVQFSPDGKSLFISSTGNDFAYSKPPVVVGGLLSKFELA